MRSLYRMLLKAVMTFIVILGIQSAAYAAWPTRPITLIVPWRAGASTDAIARLTATLLERELGQRVQVVNRTGGNGVVGHRAIADAKNDGYTLGMVTAEIAMMHHQGLGTLSVKDYTPIALMNMDAAVLSVRADAPYKTLNAVLSAAKVHPGQLTASGAGAGGVWHVSLLGLLNGVDGSTQAVRWIPSQGIAPAVANNQVTMFVTSFAQMQAMTEAGHLRPLAIMSDKGIVRDMTIPTVKTAVGVTEVMGTWRGIVGPKGLPHDIRERIAAALQHVSQQKEYQDFMRDQGFEVRYEGPNEFAAFWSKNDADVGGALKAGGLAK